MNDRVRLEGTVIDLLDAAAETLDRQVVVRPASSGLGFGREITLWESVLTVVERPRRPLRVGAVWECLANVGDRRDRF